MLKILVLEDDKDQARLLTRWLTDEGHNVSHTLSGKECLDLFKSSSFDMCILDWQLPDLSGIDVLVQIRNHMQSKIPVLFATQRNDEDDIVLALNHGADDYLVKPLRQKEVLARVNALKRRSLNGSDSELLELGPVKIKLQTQKVLVNDQIVRLTHKEYLLTCCLFRNFGKILSREFLLKEVWGIDSDLHTRTVDVHVSRLRRQLNIGPDIGYYIKTIYQHGYRLEKIEE